MKPATATPTTTSSALTRNAALIAFLGMTGATALLRPQLSEPQQMTALIILAAGLWALWPYFPRSNVFPSLLLLPVLFIIAKGFWSTSAERFVSYIGHRGLTCLALASALVLFAFIIVLRPIAAYFLTMEQPSPSAGSLPVMPNHAPA